MKFVDTITMKELKLLNMMMKSVGITGSCIVEMKKLKKYYMVFAKPLSLAFRVSFENLPLYVNSYHSLAKVVVAWRLKIGR